MTIIQGHNIVFKFHEHCDLAQWGVVDDVVMGGKSDGNLSLDKEGNGVFKGHVSIENNGGFSSIQCKLNTIDVRNYNSIRLNIKGDGSIFQFRIKHSQSDRHSYSYNFKTSGQWETVNIPLNELKPSFRGFKLNLPNFNKPNIDQIGILKASKSEVDFKLIIQSITLH